MSAPPLSEGEVAALLGIHLGDMTREERLAAINAKVASVEARRTAAKLRQQVEHLKKMVKRSRDRVAELHRNGTGLVSEVKASVRAAKLQMHQLLGQVKDFQREQKIRKREEREKAEKIALEGLPAAASISERIASLSSPPPAADKKNLIGKRSKMTALTQRFVSNAHRGAQTLMARMQLMPQEQLSVTGDSSEKESTMERALSAERKRKYEREDRGVRAEAAKVLTQDEEDRRVSRARVAKLKSERDNALALAERALSDAAAVHRLTQKAEHEALAKEAKTAARVASIKAAHDRVLVLRGIRKARLHNKESALTALRLLQAQKEAELAKEEAETREKEAEQNINSAKVAADAAQAQKDLEVARNQVAIATGALVRSKRSALLAARAARIAERLAASAIRQSHLGLPGHGDVPGASSATVHARARFQAAAPLVLTQAQAAVRDLLQSQAKVAADRNASNERAAAACDKASNDADAVHRAESALAVARDIANPFHREAQVHAAEARVSGTRAIAARSQESCRSATQEVQQADNSLRNVTIALSVATARADEERVAVLSASSDVVHMRASSRHHKLLAFPLLRGWRVAPGHVWPHGVLVGGLCFLGGVIAVNAAHVRDPILVLPTICRVRACCAALGRPRV